MLRGLFEFYFSTFTANVVFAVFEAIAGLPFPVMFTLFLFHGIGGG